MLMGGGLCGIVRLWRISRGQGDTRRVKVKGFPNLLVQSTGYASASRLFSLWPQTLSSP